MPPRPSQKRSAPSTAETSQGASHAPKKTRFVDPSEDPANFAEEVDAALEDPSTKRKGRVKTEGYDSDSSDDGEGVVLSRRKGADGEGEEDDDMFAMGEKEEKEPDSAKKKEEEFLRLGDIEGQEFANEESGSEDSEEDENQPEDEDDAERRRKAGMGFELSSFNMREEMEEGKFTEDGMYVRSYDPHGVHDKWMEGVDEKEMKQARKRKRHQERIQREKMKAEEKELQASGGKHALERQLLAFLKKGETVLEALQRLGVQAKKSKSKSAKTNGDVMQTDKIKQPSEIEQITSISSTIMGLGDTDIYSKTYEELLRSVRSSGQVDDSWIPPSADVAYEYKWDVEGAAPDSFGPYSEDEMRAWYSAAYFGEAGEKVKVRRVGGDWGSWNDVVI